MSQFSRRVLPSAFPFLYAIIATIIAAVAAQTTPATAQGNDKHLALPTMHVQIPVFWAVLTLAFATGLGFGLVFTLCWRRQMSVDKFDSEFEGTPMMGTRSSYQKEQPYQGRRMCTSCPWFLWMRI